MTLGWSSFLRVGLLLLVAVVAQISGVAQIRPLGGSADLIPLVVAAVAFFAGSVPGAATGFAAGVLLDAALGQHMGAASLVLTVVGYGVGRYREVRDPAHGLAPIAAGALATAGYVLGFAAVSFMLGIEASVSPLVLREMLVTTIFNAVLALPAFWIVRRVLRSALTVDPLEKRHRRRSEPRPAGPIGLRGLEV